MKLFIVVGLVATLAMLAFAKDANQAEYGQTAHILSCETDRVGGGDSTTWVYDPQTQQSVYGTTHHDPQFIRTLEFQVGERIYISNENGKGLAVGNEYPVRFENDRHGNVKSAHFLVNGKDRKLAITGVR